MKVGKNTVVTIDYQLLDANGTLLEEEQGIAYLHGGHGGVLPVLEAAIEGAGVGQEVRARIEPEDGFGHFDENAIRREPRSAFPADVQVGMQFAGTPDGKDDMTVYTVKEVAADHVVVDGNHPLAGQTVEFVVRVRGLRQATGEEVAHGHAHGPGGHHHH
ncbi:MAG: peptidylprolyl isomerase [Rhodocyclaceae bacterium]|nr:peptidylprolyl isomerase [Rhodocyclaceae bacterium]